jgi:hypothetical protein
MLHVPAAQAPLAVGQPGVLGTPLWVYLSADGRRWTYSHRLD